MHNKHEILCLCLPNEWILIVVEPFNIQNPKFFSFSSLHASAFLVIITKVFALIPKLFFFKYFSLKTLYIT